MTDRSWTSAIGRGFNCSCPACGKGRSLSGYLRIADACSTCGTALHHHRADDLPPYITIMIVGHIIVPLLLVVEKYARPELWVHAVIWLPLTLLLTVWLMPRVKGAVVGLQWALRMHGFANDSDNPPKP